MTISYTSTLVDLQSTVWAMAVPVPAVVVQELLSLTTERRVICCFNEQEAGKHVALMPDGQGGYFINVSKDLRKSLKITEGDEVRLKIAPDNSKYGMPMPEEMAVLLEQDEVADRLFHGLTMGKQRSLLFIIGKPKNSDTRLKKAIGITEYLKSSGGELDYKAMHAALKNRS